MYYCPFKEGRNTMGKCESDCALYSNGGCIIKKYMENQISLNEKIQKSIQAEEELINKMTIEEAEQIIYDHTPIQTIIDIYKCSNYFHVVGRAGMDYLSYKVYGNGMIVEK